MQRENAAHAESPLNRLLRKPTPETPVAKPTSAPAAPGASAAQSAPVPAAPKPPISPAEMIVNKLRSKQAPRPLPRPEPPRAPALVPEVTVAREPVDVEFTPVETPAEEPQVATVEPTPVPTATPPVPAAAKPLDRLVPAASAQPAPQDHVAPAVAPSPSSVKPLETQAPAATAPLTSRFTGPQPSAEQSAPMPEIARATQAERPQAAASPIAAAVTPPASPLEAAAPEPVAPGPAAQAAVTEAEAPSHLPEQQSPVQRLRATATEAPAQDTALRIPAGIVPRPQENAVEKSVGKLLRLPKRTRDEREFLPAALEIVDTPPSPVGRAIGFTIILVAIVAIAWACIGKVDIVATASGRIVPAGKTKVVQPADTGIVTAIHVADGDHVKAGDVLIELNSNQVSADRDRFVRDLLQANLNLARLRGLAGTLPGTAGAGKKPDLVDPPKNASPEDLALTLAAMRAQAANENAKLADLDQQIEAKRAEAAEAAAAAQKLQASLPMLADQEQLLRTMRDQKIGSKLDWYQVNQRLIEQKHEIGVLAHRKDAAEAAQRALREQRAAEATQYQMAILSELDKVRAQASELNAELAKSQQRVSQNVLLAPIDGTVQQLAIHTIGGVVTPAESLLAIVPTDDSLVVEAAVQNRDVGFISEGQTVRVKVEAFNFTLYGLIEGKVLSVTRDAVQQSNENKGKSNAQNEGDPAAADGQSGPVYMARIALDQDWMMTENGKVELTPGMAVTAEIQTGERRLISYLLSPLVRHVSESMRER
jgi:hemolysin D